MEPYWDFFGGLGRVQNGFGCTNVVEQLLFSMFSSIITFIFYLILRLFLTCWCPHGLFLWPDKGPKTVLDSTTVVEQHLFSMIPLIIILILTEFWAHFEFLCTKGYFWGRSRVQKLFWGLLI